MHTLLQDDSLQNSLLLDHKQCQVSDTIINGLKQQQKKTQYAFNLGQILVLEEKKLGLVANSQEASSVSNP